MPSPVVVLGITNLETALRVESYPIDYAKSRFVFHGIRDRIGGVGYNVAYALAHLGTPTELVTLLGQDLLGEFLLQRLAAVPLLGTRAALRLHEATLRTVIGVDGSGRAGMFTDLKDSQEFTFPVEAFLPVLEGAAIVHTSTINWALPLAKAARNKGFTISTDVQSIRSIDAAYDRRFLEVADIVFISGENLEDTPENTIRRLWKDYDVRLAVCTLAERGALLGDRSAGTIVHHPATPLRPVRNVTGAGDTFAAGFLAGMARGHSPTDCVLRGQLAAAWRLGEEGGGHGMPPPELLETEFASRRARESR